METALFLIVVILGTSGGDILISSGMKKMGELSFSRLKSVRRLTGESFSNIPFLAGVACLAASYGALMLALSRTNLSVVIPVMSLSYVTSTLGAKYLLKENISRLRWLGTAIICVGVALIST